MPHTLHCFTIRLKHTCNQAECWGVAGPTGAAAEGVAAEHAAAAAAWAVALVLAAAGKHAAAVGWA
eukprot:scaffold171150_cov26-Tisochrysis_lutea.AAC.1